MKNIQAEFADYLEAGFEAHLTLDGSCTLLQKNLNEEMHARGGAFSESVYIYKEAADLFFDLNKDEKIFSILSLGLGLGYNEVLTFISYTEKKCRGSLKIDSYEKERVLEELFLKRLKNPDSFIQYWSSFRVYRKSLEKLKALETSIFFKGPFSIESLIDLKAQKRLILFDAYSAKTNCELWTDEVLSTLFSKCLEGSVVSTYAANSKLKKALKVAGFRNTFKKGFMKKRESTLAVKEARS